MDVRLPYAAGYALEIDVLILLWGASALFWLRHSSSKPEFQSLRPFAAWSLLLWVIGVARAVAPWCSDFHSSFWLQEVVLNVLSAIAAGVLAYGVLVDISALHSWLGRKGCVALGLVAGLSDLMLRSAGGLVFASTLSSAWLALRVLEAAKTKRWTRPKYSGWLLLLVGVGLHSEFSQGMCTAMATETPFLAYREFAALLFLVMGNVCVLSQETPSLALLRVERVMGFSLCLVILGGLAAGDNFLRREFAREIQTRLAIGGGGISDADVDVLWEGRGEAWVDVYSRAWRSLSQVRGVDSRLAHVYTLSLRGGRWRVPVEGTRDWGEALPLDDENRLGKAALDARLFPLHRAGFTPPLRNETGTFVTVSIPLSDRGERGGLFLCADYTLGDWTGHLMWWRFPILVLGGASLAVLWLWLKRQSVSRSRSDTSEAVEALGRELRAPLQGILGYADLLKLNPGDPEAEENLKNLRSDASYLAHLVRQMLDLAALRSGNLVLRPERVEVRPFFEAACAAEAAEATAKALELSVVLTPRVPNTVYIDGTRYRQVVINLVSNALRFTEEGSVRLHVDWDPVRRRLLCVVRDTGVGMDPKDCQRVFGVNSAGETPTVHGPEGWGLGLSITRQLIECMKGELTVFSTPGAGTEVTVALPAEPVCDSSASVEEGPDMMAGLVVWIVEDQTPIGHLFVEYALSLGAAPTLLKSLRETQEHFKEFSAPDVLIVDRKLDDGDGFDLTREAEMRASTNVWRIAMSADDSEASREKARELGWDSFLVKPCTRREFAMAIGACPWIGEKLRLGSNAGDSWNLGKDQRLGLQREVAALMGELDVLAMSGDSRGFSKRLHALRNCMIFLGPNYMQLKLASAALEEKAKEGRIDLVEWEDLRHSLAEASVNE